LFQATAGDYWPLHGAATPPQRPPLMLESYDDDEWRSDTNVLIQALKIPREDSTSLLSDFIIWVEPRWKVFWGCFRPDGTMAWLDFKEFVSSGGSFGKQYQLGNTRRAQKWSGDTRRVFDVLCEEGCDFITTHHCLEARRHIETTRDSCEWGLSGLRKLFFAKFGCLSTAWRRVFDPDNLGRCSKVTFLQQVRKYGFHGSLNTTWAEITGGDLTRVIYLGDFDPEADRVMEHFALALATQFGSLKAGWDEVMSHAHGKRLDLPVFLDIAKQLGFHHREARKLFQCFDPRDFGMISEHATEENFKFLSFWDPTAANDRGSPSTPRSIKGSPDSAKQNFGNPDSAAVIGIDAPALTFEFQVVLSKDEYNEYLRRRRALRVEPLPLFAARKPQSPKSSSSPTKSARSVAALVGAALGQSVPVSPRSLGQHAREQSWPRTVLAPVSPRSLENKVGEFEFASPLDFVRNDGAVASPRSFSQNAGALPSPRSLGRNSVALASPRSQGSFAPGDRLNPKAADATPTRSPRASFSFPDFKASRPRDTSLGGLLQMMTPE